MRTTTLAITFAVFLLACGQSTPLQDDPAPTGPARASAHIDAGGGRVELRGASLVVPAGAVDEEVEITITASDESPAGYRAASSLFRFEPSGLHFARPVTVEVPFKGKSSALALYWSNDRGGFDRVFGARAENSVMRAEIEHFSQGFVGSVADAGESGEDVCRRGGSCQRLRHTTVTKVDILFMVDNSGSMREEQVALTEQFPHMMRALTTGDLDGDGVLEFPPVEDLHVGVVSSDIGLPGVTGVGACDGAGDDGVLQQGQGCGGLPPFLTYQAGDDPEQVADEFSCLAKLGTEGCGFEQQLESTLKALWPTSDGRITFLGDADGQGVTGHGEDTNAGFLRSDVDDPSLLAIILVTDEEDCSSADTTHFTPPQFLDPNSELAKQDLNLRCFYNPQNLYMVERYVNGFKALRPDNENLVLFAAIAGVPPDLVSAEARAGYDFANEADRESFYDGLLADPRMQEVIDMSRPADQAQNLVPSCTTDNGRAYPPRRIVETARHFGVNGVVQSICQTDFAPAIDPILERMAAELGGACMPEPLERASDGKVACDVLVRMPDGDCSDADFLTAVDGVEGLCRMAQLAVTGGSAPSGEGFYLDDFSEAARLCPGDSSQAIVLTPGARVPPGVDMFLDCD